MGRLTPTRCTGFARLQGPRKRSRSKRRKSSRGRPVGEVVTQGVRVAAQASSPCAPTGTPDPRPDGRVAAVAPNHDGGATSARVAPYAADKIAHGARFSRSRKRRDTACRSRTLPPHARPLCAGERSGPRSFGTTSRHNLSAQPLRTTSPHNLSPQPRPQPRRDLSPRPVFAASRPDPSAAAHQDVTTHPFSRTLSTRREGRRRVRRGRSAGWENRAVSVPARAGSDRPRREASKVRAGRGFGRS